MTLPEAASGELLHELEETPAFQLKGAVEKLEGGSGSTLMPIYSTRKLKCYTITDSELQQIGLANIGITSLTSIGSAFLAFWLDIFKDTLLSDGVPDLAKVVSGYVKPICLFVGIAFWLVAVALFVWRRGMINAIKAGSLET